jgi:Dolichyl-phosphate-mannose-protein mannosyltransferase
MTLPGDIGRRTLPSVSPSSRLTGSERSDHSPLTPVAWGPVIGATLTLVGVLSLFSNRYGYHRDELYFRMLPPAWGYVDQPAFTPLLARATTLVVDQPWALRMPATLCAGASVIILVLVTREVGGDRLAQLLAAWGYAFATFTLTFGHVLLTASLDLVVWPLVLLLVIRAIRRGEPRWWLLAGLVVGLSTYNKWLISLLVISVIGGLLLVGPRKTPLSRPVLAAAGLAIVLALPNVIWQATHGFPQAEMGRALAGENATEVRIGTLPILVVMIGPLLFPVCVAGFVRLLRTPEWRSIRWLASALIILVTLTLLGGTQFYYPYGLFSVIFAVGCVPAARFAQQSRGRLRLVGAVLVLHALVSVVLNLPVLPPPVLAASFVPTINSGVADQIGWPAYVGQIDRAIDQAKAADPALVVLASNYGEAGALDRFSRHPDVMVVSGHNALWDVARPPVQTRTLVFVGGQLNSHGDRFDRCQTVDRLASGIDIDNEEEGQPIAVCTGPKQDWATLWPFLRHLS